MSPPPWTSLQSSQEHSQLWGDGEKEAELKNRAANKWKVEVGLNPENYRLQGLLNSTLSHIFPINSLC